MSYQCMGFETRMRLKNKAFEEYKAKGLTDWEAEVMAKYESKPGYEYTAPEHLRMTLEEHAAAWNSAIVKLKAMGDKRGFCKRAVVDGSLYAVPPDKEKLYFPDE